MALNLPPAAPASVICDLLEIFDELDYVEFPSSDFLCLVTSKLLLEPYLTACCGNHLSEVAVTRLRREGKPCPFCRNPELVATLDEHHRRKVYEVQVRCPHPSNGCECCGHYLSKRAVARIQCEGKPCPICRKPELVTLLDRYCRYRRKVRVHSLHIGCEWVGDIGELSEHLQACHY